MTHAYFKRLGYNLLEAADGEEALQVSERYDGRIDLLITDILMPKMDGPELAAHLSVTRPETKVIFVSGYPSDHQEEFLLKPFTLAELHQKAERLIRGDGPAPTPLP